MKVGKIRKIGFSNWGEYNKKTGTRKVDLIIGKKKCGRLTLNSEQFIFLNTIVESGVLNAFDRN